MRHDATTEEGEDLPEPFRANSQGLPAKLFTLRQKLYQKAKREPKFRFYALYDRIYRQDGVADVRHWRPSVASARTARAIADVPASFVIHPPFDPPSAQAVPPPEPFPMSAAAPLVVSRVLGRRLGGRYRVDAVLATGGMGAVFRAEDVRLHRPVAVKVLTLHADNPALEAELRRWFQREARAAASLRHPNVVTVHDFGNDAELDLDYLVMELLPGRDVAGRLAEAGAPLSTAEAVEVFREAAMGLAAGHRAGIVHRDVKPRNIFLVEDPGGGWEVKLLDFGIADAVEAGTGEAAAGGKPGPHTPRYASPEQLRGQAGTPASDVYSLGLTAMEMLCGRHPDELRGAADDGPARRRLAALCAADRTLRPAIAGVLLRAVHPDPARRFADAGQLLQALEPALGTPYGRVVLAPGPDAAPAGAPPHPRRAEAGSRTLHPEPDPTPPLAAAAPPRTLPSAMTAGLARRAAAAQSRPADATANDEAQSSGAGSAIGFGVFLLLLIVLVPFLEIAARDGVAAAWDAYAGVLREARLGKGLVSRVRQAAQARRVRQARRASRCASTTGRPSRRRSMNAFRGWATRPR